MGKKALAHPSGAPGKNESARMDAEADIFTKQLCDFLAERRRLHATDQNQAHGPIMALRWNAAQQINQALWDHLSAAIALGCTHPDRPIEIDFNDTCLLNFGCHPGLLHGDDARFRKESDLPALDETQRREWLRRRMGLLEMHYSEFHATTGVYNAEPWIQEVYRDFLDCDYREVVKERIRAKRNDIQGIPARLMKLGLPKEAVSEVMAALRSFDKIRDAAYVREKSKTSVLHIRDFAKVHADIDRVMRGAEEHVVHRSHGRAQEALQEIFTFWKECTYDLLDLHQELMQHVQYGMGQVVDRIDNILLALRKTLERCAEGMGQPPCYVLDAEEAGRICPRQAVEEAFEALQVYDPMGTVDPASSRMEARRYGPLCVLLAPGSGMARYSRELRALQNERLSDAKDKPREYDLDRRIRYPFNYIVFPNQVPPEQALEALADAFLEWKALAHPAAYRPFVEEARKKFPTVFDASAEDEREKHMDSKARIRFRLSRYLAGFVLWAKYGRARDLPDMEAFRAWAESRMPRPAFLVPPRYGGVLGDFLDASPDRRELLFRRHMGSRYDAQIERLAVLAIRGDLEGAEEAVAPLSRKLRQDPQVLTALRTHASQDPGTRQRAADMVRRFLLSLPELKRIHLTTEARLQTEVDALRARAFEKLGKQIPLDEAMAAVVQRHLQEVEQRCRQSGESTDHDLLGLFYIVDENPDAAVEELRRYMVKLEAQRDLRARFAPRYDGRFLEDNLGHRARRMYDGRTREEKTASATRLVGQLGDEWIHEDEFVYYNAAILESRRGRLKEASDFLSRFCLWAAQRNWHLLVLRAQERNEEIGGKMADANAAQEPE